MAFSRDFHIAFAGSSDVTDRPRHGRRYSIVKNTTPRFVASLSATSLVGRNRARIAIGWP
jgi:hypothetical protein